ncbi:N-6 DNA methylase [Salmonella enterica]|nr:N-6 DNA methylase [Salmonella enterica subsp. enterica serovar Derby]EEF7678512.1 N-6 DNA methylase [Salmonella enterica subsp. enterica serovar Derby]EIU4644289.1 Eco57I restriction-modification methylase domain-containing protein [Salmonella enterica subsp. enterica serovar Derby]EIU4644671.1 Eco57I restriction-modification methylase domain-containing protein [Salmonella enterica subsp. enterica serovar Derby]
MNAFHFQDLLSESAEPLVRYEACKGMARGYANSVIDDQYRLKIARSYCAALIKSYWDEINARHNSKLKIFSIPTDSELAEITLDAEDVAKNTGKVIAQFPDIDAGYLIGSIYTAMLPTAYRSDLGAYYTPPPLVSRLLDLAEEAGVDFSTASVIDPACGGGAFLAPVAMRMLQRSKHASSEWKLAQIGKRLKGVEIDPFAAWMTHVLLECVLIEHCIIARRRLAKSVISICDALTYQSPVDFDLVIGNPPYGKVSLDTEVREKFSRSLFGHANLYGLFTDLALRLAKPEGVIAYLTPTSFLGGQYFKALRELLIDESAPRAFDFISNREGVFDDVLQETLLATFKKSARKTPAKVSLLVPEGLNEARVEPIGKVSIIKGDGPWLIPRVAEDAALLNRLKKMKTRLPDLGYVVSTGKLVWNRHKSQLRTEKTKGALPLVWAESVTSNGFKFSSVKRNHVPYIQIEKNQRHLVTTDSCVLVQRTTSKEQNRRVLGVVIPQDFIDRYGGVVVENHLNIVYADTLIRELSVETINGLLNSQVFDRIYRCISGSVAVSAYELMAVPLPSLDDMKKLEKIIAAGSDRLSIEKCIAGLYGESKLELATCTKSGGDC